MQNLVIVESPTKAKTLAKYLGDKYQITASMGHIIDLPKSELGVDTEHNFEPKYIVPRDKRKKANELTKMAKEARTIWLASDPDREGEAIAWHISELLHSSEGRGKGKGKSDAKPHPEPAEGEARQRRLDSGSSKQIKRVVFHEITEEAIKEAFNHPRGIDIQLVDAQQARRVLDRLVGYKLSPLLWQKVKKGLSAGRVQSVALRLIVEREKEVLAFKPEEYWVIQVEVSSAGPASSVSRRTSSVISLPAGVRQDPSSLSPANHFFVTLIEINGQKPEIKNEQEAKVAVKFLENASYQVKSVTKKEVKRNPYPPFITSTLQQASANKLGYSAEKTMSLAQGLYERGLITYMRTDSVNLAVSAVDAARKYIKEKFGQNYLPQQARVFKSKSKNAQEAHEAIRPTSVTTIADQVTELGDLNRDHARLYDLIWKRFIACQMIEALLDQTTIDVSASLKSDNYTLRATGSIVRFDGWLKVFEGKKKEEDEEEALGDEGNILPEVKDGDPLQKLQVLPGQHFTQPPPRYNEASLIKKLEELGIGRPSTYAPILSTLQERYYVERRERRLFPTDLGTTVVDFLLKYFPDIMDYTFTAQMEDELDEVARGERKWQPTIKEFYGPFEKKVESTSETAEKMTPPVETTDQKCPECGKPLVVRYGKFGKFLACSGFPECNHTEGLEEKIDAKCSLDGGEVVVRRTKHGKTFYGCKNWPTCTFASWTKPKSPSTNKEEANS